MMRAPQFGLLAFVALVAFPGTLAHRAAAEATPAGLGVAVPAESAELAERPAPPRSLTYAAWRASEPVTIVTEAEAQAALIEAGLRWDEAEALAQAAATCEAPVWDTRAGVSIGIRLAERGDNGRAHGGFAVRVDVHPELAQRYDLDTLDGGAAAAVEIRDEAARIWGEPLRPWACVR